VSVSLQLAMRYLWGRKLRTALTTLAVVFGVAVYFGVNGMIPAVLSAFESNLFASAGQVDLAVSSTSSGLFAPQIADTVARVPGVAAVTPELRQALTLPLGGPVASVTIVGIDPTSASKVRGFPVSSGRFLYPNDRGSVVIGEDLASKLGASVGSSIVLPAVSGNQQYHVIGILSLPSTPGAPEVFMTLPDAQSIFGAGVKVNTVEGVIAKGEDRTAVQQAVQRALGSDYLIGGVSSGSQILQSLQVGQFAVNMFGVFALVMGAFIILNTFRTVVAERRHDIGMLRAVGASRSVVLGMFLWESVVQGALGTAVGLAVGWLIGYGAIAGINPVYHAALNVTVPGPQFSIGTYVSAIILGIGFTVAGAVGPAITASRLTPLEALRPPVADVQTRVKMGWRWFGWALVGGSAAGLFSGNAGLVGLSAVTLLIGMVVVAPGLIAPLSRLFGGVLQLVFRSEGGLARSNIERQPTRAATTAAAIMISLTIVIAMIGVLGSISAGFLGYLSKSLGSDFVVIPTGLLLGGGHVGVEPAVVAQIQSLPGVGNTATLNYAQATSGGSIVGVIGVDPKAYPKVATFDWSGGSSNADITKLSSGRTVIANGLYASSKNLHIGSKLPIDTPDGTKTYTVVGIGNDYLNAKLPTVYTSQDNLYNDFGVANAALMLIDVAPGGSVAQVKRELTLVLASYPQFTLYDSASFRAAQAATFNQVFVLLYALVGILALPTLLALLNTLAISVLARTRELGMLRAVGSTKRQVTNMVLAESLLLATIGILFGVLGGVALGYALILATNAFGYISPYAFPWTGILVGAIVSYLFAWLAAWWPSRQASKLDIVAALHYE
jgi:putative ABC transport system permease protein